MLRKTMLALVAGVALGAAALAPTSASAAWGGWHGGWGGWHGGWYRGPIVRVYGGGPVYGGCSVQRWVYTPYGPALRWVNVCY
jgi:hypothetical protein